MTRNACADCARGVGLRKVTVAVKLDLRRAISSAAVLAIAGGILAATAGTAFAAGQTPTTTTLTASPNPPAQGQPTTLTATETPATAGTMTFTSGTTTIGSSSVNPSTGVATLSYTPSAAGTITATFTPTDTVNYASSSGSTTLSVTVVTPVFTVSLTVSQTGVAGTPISLSSTVMVGTTLVSAGTVSWYDNGSTTALNSTPVTPNASGVAAYTITAGLAAGPHSIVAVFTPPSTTGFQPSQSAPQAFTLQAPQVPACEQTGSQCIDLQNIEATVPVGTLVITTPYTASNVLNLGNLALNSGLTEYSAAAPFNGITVADTRAGDLPWTLTALASNLSDGKTNAGSLICSQNVGLTGVTSAPGTGFAGTVTATDNAAATPPVAPSGGACAGTQGLGGTTAHTVAAASAGLGTDVLNGTLTLTAPTSTEPGIFTGTITFTVG